MKSFQRAWLQFIGKQNDCQTDWDSLLTTYSSSFRMLLEKFPSITLHNTEKAHVVISVYVAFDFVYVNAWHCLIVPPGKLFLLKIHFVGAFCFKDFYFVVKTCLGKPFLSSCWVCIRKPKKVQVDDEIAPARKFSFNLCTHHIQSLERNWNFYVLLIFMRFALRTLRAPHCCVSDNDRHEFTQSHSMIIPPRAGNSGSPQNCSLSWCHMWNNFVNGHNFQQFFTQTIQFQLTFTTFLHYSYSYQPIYSDVDDQPDEFLMDLIARYGQTIMNSRNDLEKWVAHCWTLWVSLIPSFHSIYLMTAKRSRNGSC